MNETLQVLKTVTAALEQAGVPYRVGGSVASSALGVPRMTLDIDIVADLRPHHIAPLAKLLGPDFYFDTEHALEAIQRRSGFNLLHFASAIKVDLFLPQPTPFEQSAFARELRITMDEPAPPQSIAFSTAEDTLLHKLRWYELGGRVSERQWGDVLGILRVQTHLDWAYLRHWAAALGLLGLLEQALREAEAL
ncbi:hypothetical protein [Meiothermus sp. CFH 77666]|uniref:hypothetical protein n=1 Tax=Meiothermus sp. CFH 77666 TaxID=2817942 RepID=UPI001AA00E1F|nr:hypothetical protein [Meiothermus sp. CFH 77666]MBO1438250.1 hypothetical protein [Meiothermus sp. CFH 77666]